MRQGKQAGGRAINPPYGLGDPDHADVVCKLFTDFTDPYRRPSLSELAQALNVDGVVTARGGQWHASTVRYVLRNDAYADLVGRDLLMLRNPGYHDCGLVRPRDWRWALKDVT